MCFWPARGSSDEVVALISCRNSLDEQPNLNKLLWDRIPPLLYEADADLFVIFDCCYAGALANGRSSMPAQCFEFLGSTGGDQTALGPGRNSFTSALIDALGKLKSKADGFSVAELKEQVESAPYFRTADQKPSYDPTWGGRRYGPKLRIRPLLSQSTPAPVASVSKSEDVIEKIQHAVRIDLTFNQCPNEKDVIVLADDLAQLAKTSETPICSVLWCMLSRHTKRTSLEKFKQAAWDIGRRRRLTAKSQDRAPTLDSLPNGAVVDLDEVSPIISRSSPMHEYDTNADDVFVQQANNTKSTRTAGRLHLTGVPAIAVALVLGVFMGRVSHRWRAFGAT